MSWDRDLPAAVSTVFVWDSPGVWGPCVLSAVVGSSKPGWHVTWRPGEERDLHAQHGYLGLRFHGHLGCEHPVLPPLVPSLQGGAR